MAKPTVAIIGASADPTKFGNKSVVAHADRGYDVYPINPRGGVIEGLTAYTSIADTPVDRFDRVSLYVPPQVGLGLLDEIAAKGCDELWLNPGADSQDMVDRAQELGLNPIVACSIVDANSR